MELRKELMEKLSLDELGFIKYCIDTMKEHKLSFAFLALETIEDSEGIKKKLEDEGYTVTIEKETFKIFWNDNIGKQEVATT